jgi:hypothetical protein
VYTASPHPRKVDSVDSAQDIDAPGLSSQHPDPSGSSELADRRQQATEAEFDERSAQPARIHDAWSDQHVEIIGEPWFTVRRDCVSSDEDEPHAMRDQKTQELGPVSTEFDLHRTRPFSGV